MTPALIWRMTVNVLLGSLAYRGFFATLMFERVLGPLIGLLIWLTVEAQGVALPYDRSQLISYYVLLSVISMISGHWCAEYVAEQIRLGGLSTLLLRPAPFIAWWACDALGQKLLMSTLLLPQVGLFALLFRPTLPPASSSAAALFLVSTMFATTLAFLIQFNIGLLAFWMEDVRGVISLEGAARALLAGELVPLALFPTWLLPLAEALPFRYTLSFPLEVLTRDLSSEALARGFALQIAYTAAAYSLYRLVWWRGLRRYSATGA